MQVKLKRLNAYAVLPIYETPGAAGADLRYEGGPEGNQTVYLHPGQRHLFTTGFAIELSPGYEAQIRPRSGMAVKDGVTVANAPGTIDQDYRGEVRVCLVNLGEKPVTIAPQDRIAQMIIAPVIRGEFSEVKALDDTQRGSGGFGSTGTA